MSSKDCRSSRRWARLVRCCALLLVVLLGLAAGCREDQAPQKEAVAAREAEEEEQAQYEIHVAAPTGAVAQSAPHFVREAALDERPSPQAPQTFIDHGVNPWVDTAVDRLSTFAVDVDTASYTLTRRMLEEGKRPPAAAVRVEEFINYFDYHYPAPAPESQMPFQVDLEAAPSPFAKGTTLLRVGVQGQQLSAQTRKAAHLTFLVDTSGSMQGPDRLGIAKQALAMLVAQLEPRDTVALVTYAGSTEVVLEPTPASERQRILDALDRLDASGSTAMASGLELAYQQAMATFEEGAVNRVIVISDGDANVGATTHRDILNSINHYVAAGVTLSTIGVGMGNYRASHMEQLANRGNGNNYYFDSLDQAKRVFVDQLPGTLQVIARDVKLQVEFDPATVSEYRLIGYENRDIADEDFRNDKVDAGEIGAGHNVTALYELRLSEGASADAPLATVHVRHKAPDGRADETPAVEHRFSLRVGDRRERFEDATADTRFATSVAAFAERLRESPERAQLPFETIAALAREASGDDAERQAFLELVERASRL